LKAFFYTLVVVAVLIAAIIFLQSLPQPATTRRSGLPAPMKVKSQPAALPSADADLATKNRDALFTTGVELLDLWHITEAIGIFENIVATDSTQTAAYLKLVECYSHPMIALESEATRCLEKAFELCRRSGADTVWAAAVGSYYAADSPELTVDILKKLDKKAAAKDDALLLAGAAYLKTGDYARAERYLGDLLDRDPSHGRAKELYIRLKTIRGDLRGAERAARDLASTYPEEPYPYVLLSQVLLSAGKIDQAREFANNALDLDPRYVPAIVARANVHAADGDLEAARVGFEKLLLFDKPMLSATAMDGIAYTEFLSGEFDQASNDMDEAVRYAVGAGSVRHGLGYAFRLIDYLCQLGRPDMAEAVWDRWVTRAGDVPSGLGQLRIQLMKGDIQSVRRGLERIQNASDWRRWMRWLDIDYTDLYALSLIREENYAGAIALMDAAKPAAAENGRRAYLKGYALFENGAAESAGEILSSARSKMCGLEFPYHGDPVLYVQSFFFSAEAALARGQSEEAGKYYEEFLNYWDGAEWDLQAVARARTKLETLSRAPSPSPNG
jgi:tetratricopeptide (TPR) repeat protein